VEQRLEELKHGQLSQTLSMAGRNELAFSLVNKAESAAGCGRNMGLPISVPATKQAAPFIHPVVSEGVSPTYRAR
jgi:hypothetical protein